jgi:hypothetical protein
MSAGTVARWVRYVGDTDTITVRLGGVDSLQPGAVVTASVMVAGLPVALSPASVTNGPEREVTIELTTWLADAVPGVYEIRISIDDKTWPDFGKAEIEVRA